jgi:predicted ATP-grasp superfamily ATP-dependent carboligase
MSSGYPQAVPRICAVGSRPTLNRDRIAAYARSGIHPPAVVCDASFVNGLTAIRSLGRMGVPVFAVDHRPSALGFRSRYAFALRSPDPGTDTDAYIDLLVELGDAIGRPTPILPTHDPPVNAIGRHRTELGDRYLCPFPDEERLARVQSKREQLDQAAGAGVDVPETAHPRSRDDAVVAAGRIGYPVLVKPSNPDGFRRRFGRQAFRCETPQELERAYADAEPFEPMVQELIPGGDDELYTVGTYIAADGAVLAVFSGRKLRQSPPGVGTCRVGEAVWVQESVESALRLLRAFEFHGVSQVEFKRDPRDGRFKLMEINPRLWLWHGLAAALGVDFARIAYLDLLGRRGEPVTTEGKSGRWAITLLAGESPALQRPPYVEPVFSLDDLRPGATQLARVVKAALS